MRQMQGQEQNVAALTDAVMPTLQDGMADKRSAFVKISPDDQHVQSESTSHNTVAGNE